MRKLRQIVLTGLMVTLASVPVSATQKTLDSLVATALRRYPDLQAAGYAVEASQEAARASGSLPETNFSLALMNLPTGSFAFDETPMTGIWLGAAQRIPWPGKLKAQSRLAGLRNEQDQASFQDMRDRLIREVTDAYWEFSYWSLTKKSLAEYLTLLDATDRIAEERYANGQSSAQDLLRISTMITRMKVRQSKADQMAESARVRLARAVGDTAMVRNIDTYLPEPSAAEAIPTIDGNPALVRARLGQAASKAGYDLARSEYKPDFTIGLDYGIRQNVAGDPVHGDDFVNFKVGFSLPIFAGQKHRVRSAEHASEAAAEQTRAVQDRLASELEKARLSLDYTTSSLTKYSDEILPQAQAALEAAEVAYEVDKIDFNALLDAQTDLIDVRLERLDLLRQHNQTLSLINQLTGQKSGR